MLSPKAKHTFHPAQPTSPATKPTSPAAIGREIAGLLAREASGTLSRKDKETLAEWLWFLALDKKRARAIAEAFPARRLQVEVAHLGK